jgi:hypothetical protein
LKNVSALSFNNRPTVNLVTHCSIPKIHVFFQEDIEEEDLVTGTEEAMEADMKIEEVETNQAATLILADAIEEIQTGDLLLKMILERPPQVNKKKSRSINA